MVWRIIEFEMKDRESLEEEYICYLHHSQRFDLIHIAQSDTSFKAKLKMRLSRGRPILKINIPFNKGMNGSKNKSWER